MYLTLTLFYPSRPTCYNRVLDLRPTPPTPPPLDLSPIVPLSFTRRCHFSLSLHPLPPPPSRPKTERPATWTDLSPVGLHSLSALPSHSGQPKEFLARACDCLTLSRCPLFAVLDLLPGPCHPQGLFHPRVPSSLCLTPSYACTPTLPPLPASTGVPVP